MWNFHLLMNEEVFLTLKQSIISVGGVCLSVNMKKDTGR